MKKKTFGGGLTIPTETGFVDETLKLLERWGADAVRDCDGTAMPDEIKRAGYKIYSTYFVGSAAITNLQRPCPMRGHISSYAANISPQRRKHWSWIFYADISSNRFNRNTIAT